MNHSTIPTSWKKTILSSIAVLFFTFNASSQVDTLKWINKSAYQLPSDAHANPSDYSFLTRELKGKYIVGLGEASHGTHEFYIEKARIITYLIENCGFRTISFEIQDSIMVEINSFVQTGQGDLRKLMTGTGLYRTEEIYALFLKLRDYNKNNAPGKRVKLTGFDHADYWSDPISRDRFMAKNVTEMVPDQKNKIILWAHNVHMLKDTTAKYWSMGAYLKKHFGDRYFALVLDTYKGSVNVLNQGKFEAHTFQTREQTLSGTLSKAQPTRFYLKFGAKRDPFKAALSLITNIYSNWQEPKPITVRPGIDFDAILFMKDTTPSIELKQ